jgi:signal transduction histidine kinase
LGLYIAKEAALRLNGTLSISLNSDKGCTFCLQIPEQPK